MVRGRVTVSPARPLPRVSVWEIYGEPLQRLETADDGRMYRVVAFAIGGMVLLVVDVAAVYVAASSSALPLALLLCLPGLVLIWALLAVGFDVRRRPYWRWPHRGATRVGYNPWIGGGVDEDK
jgi:hypothetical protein